MKVPYVHEEVIHNMKAPEEMIPYFLKTFKPKSVLDVGCGTGTWLKSFYDRGVKDINGIDGPYVELNKLVIPVEKFISKDLNRPFELNRRFDLIICLEVAEHLIEESADALVDSLIRHGDTIVFSAAVPGQGGQNHINEQWPNYWKEKFNKRGFYFRDEIRPIFWGNEKIDWWYRQNVFLVTKDKGDEKPPPNLSLIHPELLKSKNRTIAELNKSFRKGEIGVWVSFLAFLNSIKFKFSYLLKKGEKHNR